MARRIRSLLLIAIGGLYVLSIPWYREPGSAPQREGWLGVPDWVAVALLCYVGAAVLNSVAWALTDISEEPDGAAPDEAGQEPR